MIPAHTRRTAVGAVLAAALGLAVITLVQGTPPWSATATAQAAAGHYDQLLSQPVAPAAAPASHRAAATLPSPCARNTRTQLIVVSIKHQHAWACAGSRTVLSTPVTTGVRGDRTPRGSFAVQGLIRNTTLTTNEGSSYHVRYWIPFHLGEWGFHDAPWQKIPFGSSRFLTGGSHGCVHLPLKAMRKLFHWVHYGTIVRIH